MCDCGYAPSAESRFASAAVADKIDVVSGCRANVWTSLGGPAVSKTIAYASKRLPVILSGDVVVCGGGPAGAAAAIAAARSGAKVILLEQLGCLGGLGTAGIVPCFCPFSDGEKPVVRGIGEEVLIEMARRMKRPVNYDWMPIQPEILKAVYDDMVETAGPVLRLHTKVVDVVGKGRLNAVVISTKGGLKAVAGKVFVDATGDGDVSTWAGADFEVGGARGETMGPSLCPTFAGIDWNAFDANRRPGPRPDQVIWMRHLKQGRAPIAEWHLAAGVLKVGRSIGSGNIGHVYGVSGLDEAGLTRGMVDGRRMLWKFLDWYRRNVPGFRNAEMAATASILGVRETRRIVGDYVLNFDDYRARASFPDEIGRLSYPVDIHSSTTRPKEQRAVEKRLRATSLAKGESYGIPYRALVVRGLENLLVAGRCVSTDRAVQSSLRVMPGCFVTGQAAGVAAALAAKRHKGNVRSVDVSQLRSTLRSQNAYVP